MPSIPPWAQSILGRKSTTKNYVEFDNTLQRNSGGAGGATGGYTSHSFSGYEGCGSEELRRTALSVSKCKQADIEGFLWKLTAEESSACAAFCHFVSRDLRPSPSKACSSDAPPADWAPPGELGGGGGASTIVQDVAVTEAAIRSIVSQGIGDMQGELQGMRTNLAASIEELRQALLEELSSKAWGPMVPPSDSERAKGGKSNAGRSKDPADDEVDYPRTLGKQRSSGAFHSATEGTHPLCKCLTSKTFVVEEAQILLDSALSLGNPIDLESPLDETNCIPAPLFYAVGMRNCDLVKLLIDYRANVTRRFPGPKMWNGIKKGRTALEATLDRKAHFQGTALGAQYLAIEEVLLAEIGRNSNSVIDVPIAEPELQGIVMGRCSSDPAIQDSAGVVTEKGQESAKTAEAAESRPSSRITEIQRNDLEVAKQLSEQLAPVGKKSLAFNVDDDADEEKKEPVQRAPSQKRKTFCRSVTQPLKRGNSRHSLTLTSSQGPIELVAETQSMLQCPVCDHFEDTDPALHFDVNSAKVGEGSFGTVRVGTHKETGLQRAIKSVPKVLLDQGDLWQEISIMRQLDHPHILRLYSTYEDAKFVYLVSELCAGGELFDALVEEEAGFTEKTGARLMKQMLQSVGYLHARQICHRDLKPENFLLTHKNNLENAHIKLIDFGTAKSFADGELMTTKICTVLYVAPEVLTKQNRPYTEVCDMWSLGVVMYLLLSGQPPWHGENDMAIMKQIKKGKYAMDPPDLWDNISEDAKDLLKKMLQVKPDLRYTAKLALSHRWIVDLAPAALEGVCLSGLAQRLRAFKNQNRLKKIALQVIAQQLSDEHIEHLRTAFMSLDQDGSGALQVEEIESAIKAMDMEADVALEMTQMLWEMAAQNNGEVNYTQFLGATLDRKHYLQEEAVKAAFNCFDVDGDGFITKEELALVLGLGGEDQGKCAGIAGDLKTAMGVTEVESIFQEVDQDGDGTIDFQEFMDMMRGGGPGAIGGKS